MLAGAKFPESTGLMDKDAAACQMLRRGLHVLHG